MNELNHLNLQKRLKDRFFRYIAIESQSQEGVNEVPSTSLEQGSDESERVLITSREMQ
jgi:di/tripeptidase